MFHEVYLSGEGEEEIFCPLNYKISSFLFVDLTLRRFEEFKSLASCFVDIVRFS